MLTCLRPMSKVQKPVIYLTSSFLQRSKPKRNGKFGLQSVGQGGKYKIKVSGGRVGKFIEVGT
jgi:hypothetical protein